MKKTLYLFISCAVVLLSACSLDQEPQGSTITENQYEHMDNMVEGTVYGCYSLLYPYGGDHDVFGQRSIDMYGDILCGDMAMKRANYGWFLSDEQRLTYGRRSYIWSYYYGFIRRINKTLNVIDRNGRPELEFDLDEISDEQYYNGFFCAELFALRGWAYAGLLRYFTSPTAEIDPATEPAVPIYTEEDTQADTLIGSPRATVADVYLRVEEDLMQAIQYFEAYNLLERSSKLEINADVARLILAYSYLNKGDYENALKYADEVITTTTANILPQKEVLTTGFNNVDNNNWLWGQDVTVQTTTALASFFGQCDIYSYSYASAGDVKGIDANLYKEVQNLKWDIREGWWNNYASSGKRNASTYAYAPDGKFYSAKSKELQGDRDWLSDNVYMRLELAYLIAAEAACQLQKTTEACNYLFAITDERVKTGSEDAYEAWKNGLTDNGKILDAIRYNWRVELWGEGYGLQTFRRYNREVQLGDNHRSSTKTLSPGTPRLFTFELPTGELYYNPYIRSTTEMGVKQ